MNPETETKVLIRALGALIAVVLLSGAGAVPLLLEEGSGFSVDLVPLACSDPRFGEALLGGYSSTGRSQWSRWRGSRMGGGCSRRSSSGNRSNACCEVR